MHDAVLHYVRRFGSLKPLEIVDIGGRDLNGNPWGFWPNARWTVVDLRPGKGVDVVADAATWRPELEWDLVLCCEVFEHVEPWPAIVETCYQLLRPGGRAIFTCAGPGRAEHSGIEATPITPGEYYANVSADDLRSAMMVSGFGAVECSQVGLDIQASGIRPANH
jgi:SAM-dependent methyltransferase